MCDSNIHHYVVYHSIRILALTALFVSEDNKNYRWDSDYEVGDVGEDQRRFKQSDPEPVNQVKRSVEKDAWSTDKPPIERADDGDNCCDAVQHSVL